MPAVAGGPALVPAEKGALEMNWSQIEARWEQVKGDVKSAWGKLTDDDIAFVGGKLDKLLGKIVERYGVKKEQAHQQVSEWADRLATRLDAIGRSREHQHAEDPSSTPRH
jgi:uncharacterized protein YjbJ (UPF0337 family)